MLFVPIVLDPFSFHEQRFVWEYFKYSYHCYVNNWPIIMHEKYKKFFVGSNELESNHYFTKDFTTRHQFEPLDTREINKMERYFIPDDIFDKLIEEKGSRLEAKLFLLKNRYKPLEDVVEKYISHIQEIHGEIGGVINWAAHFESIRYLAKKYGIRVITQEYAIRHVNYRSCCYLCDDIYDSKACYRMYEQFKEECGKIEFELLSREEILALFVTPRTAEVIKRYKGIEPEFEIGMAGVHPFITTFLAKSMYTDLELCLDIRRKYKDDNILFRMHPGDEPFQANYGFKYIDDSKTAAEFICRCKKIAAIGSNIIPEALLWGKPVYTNDISPFFCFCQKKLDNKESWVLDETVLNFIFFVFLVPFEYICNSEYLNWRMKNPSMVELYMKHLEFYLMQEDISSEILKCKKYLRYSEMMIVRGLVDYL